MAKKRRRPVPGQSRPYESESHEAEDAFIARTITATAWAKQNRQHLIIGVVALALVLWVIMTYVGNRAALENRAIAELELIHETVGLGDPEAAKVELGSFLARYSSGLQVLEARLVLGGLYLESFEVDQAVSVLEPAVESIDTPLGLQVAFLLGAAYEEQGSWADAQDIYLRIADEAELEYQVVDALANVARIRESTGDLAGAAELYQEVVDTFENESHPERGAFLMRLAELRARM